MPKTSRTQGRRVEARIGRYVFAVSVSPDGDVAGIYRIYRPAQPWGAEIEHAIYIQYSIGKVQVTESMFVGGSMWGHILADVKLNARVVRHMEKYVAEITEYIETGDYDGIAKSFEKMTKYIFRLQQQYAAKINETFDKLLMLLAALAKEERVRRFLRTKRARIVIEQFVYNYVLE